MDLAYHRPPRGVVIPRAFGVATFCGDPRLPERNPQIEFLLLARRVVGHALQEVQALLQLSDRFRHR